MADGARKHDWGIASAILCLLANANRDPKKQSRPFSPADFDPTHEKATVENDTYVPITILKDLFVDGKDILTTREDPVHG